MVGQAPVFKLQMMRLLEGVYATGFYGQKLSREQPNCSTYGTLRIRLGLVLMMMSLEQYVVYLSHVLIQC